MNILQLIFAVTHSVLSRRVNNIINFSLNIFFIKWKCICLSHKPHFIQQFSIVIKWHHNMWTLSTYLALLEGNRMVTGDSPHKGPVMHSFGVFVVAGMMKLLKKTSNVQWFEMLWWLLADLLAIESLFLIPTTHLKIKPRWSAYKYLQMRLPVVQRGLCQKNNA